MAAGTETSVLQGQSKQVWLLAPEVNSCFLLASSGAGGRDLHMLVLLHHGEGTRGRGEC